MRIAIDLQAAQATNRHRGIGRYALSLTTAVLRNAPEHDYVIMLNAAFPQAVVEIREALRGLIEPDAIRVWAGPRNAASWRTTSPWQRRSGELIREAFIESLHADVVLVTSMFEGFIDAAVTSVARAEHVTLTAAVLYDLIPLLRPDDYLTDADQAAWYDSKIQAIRRCDLLLAISESTRQEAVAELQFADSDVVNISGAVGSDFHPTTIGSDDERDIRRRFGLHRPFVMYTGGIDKRKNIEGLIVAFAGMPTELRTRHQLAIVCAADEPSQQRLQTLAAANGLSPDELVMCGFVSEADLVALYNLCELFVFPSLREGFGLPVLEAMACGRAVIAANNSSLPEIIDFPEALFDSTGSESMTAKIVEALTDETFRGRLQVHGLERASQFSWDASARLAIHALEVLHAERTSAHHVARPPSQRLRLAYVSPLPPAGSGISDYSAEMLRELAEYYDIDVVVNQAEVSDPWILGHCSQRDVAWFRANHRVFDRVVYNFGNSEFHAHMFGLLADIPGVVILHDFFLSGIVAHMDVHMRLTPGNWPVELYRSHGYTAAAERFHATDTADVVWRYPANISVLQNATGIVVHSNTSRRLARRWYGPTAADGWARIPHVRSPAGSVDRARAREQLGFGVDDFVVCSFGIAGPSKFSQRLVDVCRSHGLLDHPRFHLVLVGENLAGAYGDSLQASLGTPDVDGPSGITGRVDRATYQQYLAAADVAVQLRSFTQGETSGAVLDCMNYEVATIVNACGDLADLPDDCVLKLEDDFSDQELADAMVRLRDDDDLRRSLAACGLAHVRAVHDPRACAEQVMRYVESSHLRPLNNRAHLIDEIASLPDPPDDDAALIDVSRAIVAATTPRPAMRTIFVDISELAQHDAKTGIQRVTRNIMRWLLAEPPAGFRIEPVYATATDQYRYARSFTERLLRCPDIGLPDDIIEFALGDIFLALDLQPVVVAAQRSFFQDLRGFGVRVVFVVYDLLPLLVPHAFVPGAVSSYSAWLDVVLESDGALAISESVANDLRNWISPDTAGSRPFMIESFPLGSDLDGDLEIDSTEGSVAAAPGHAHPSRRDATTTTVMREIEARSSFLMVGTIEPRKRHEQVLAAFEVLWASGVDTNLVFVGKQGWMVDSLCAALRRHPERGHRLFWLESLSDAALADVYRRSTCLIAASLSEGFGLPIIEAANHGLPVIARDIPPFREVAGDHAHYFADDNSEAFADSIRQWLRLHEAGEAPSTHDLQRVSWQQSKDRVVALLGCIEPVGTAGS